jgi:hypothetical protein
MWNSQPEQFFRGEVFAKSFVTKVSQVSSAGRGLAGVELRRCVRLRPEMYCIEIMRLFSEKLDLIKFSGRSGH